jgi:hypothetical protein
MLDNKYKSFEYTIDVYKEGNRVCKVINRLCREITRFYDKGYVFSLETGRLLKGQEALNYRSVMSQNLRFLVSRLYRIDLNDRAIWWDFVGPRGGLYNKSGRQYCLLIHVGFEKMDLDIGRYKQ